MRIPDSSGFGEVVSDPVKLDRRQTAADAFGGGIGRAVQNIGMDMLNEQRREQREAEATRDAADRATAVRTVHAVRDSLAAAHDEVAELVRTGELPKEEAAARWQERSREISENMTTGVPAKYLPDTQADIESQNARYTRGIQKAIGQRDQADVRAGLDSTKEAAQRLYMKDPAAAQAMLDGAYETMGPHSGLAPDQLAKDRQTWTESTRFTKAGELILSARGDNKALTGVSELLKSDEFAPLDPQRRLQLETQIEGFKASNIQRAEAEARRIEAKREQQLKKAESAYNAASGLVLTGKMLSPEYVTKLTRDTAGTSFADALPELIRQAPERSAFGMQPLDTMDRIISQTRATLNVNGTDDAIEKRVKQMEQVRDQARKDYAEDALPAALERGVLQNIEPVNTSSVAALVTTIGARVQQAGLVSTKVGQSVSPLLKHEAEAVSKIINVLPLAERSSAIAQLAEVVGPQQASALGRQMAPKDKPLGIALGLAGSRTTEGRYTSEIVLRGAQAIKDRSVKDDNGVMTGVRARVAAEIGDAYMNQELRQTMIDAAVYAEYGLQSEGSGDLRRAVNLVTGGITERAGRKVPLPYGIKAPEFEKKLSAMTPDDISKQVPDGKVYVAGVPMDAAAFVKAVPTARLIHAGNGRYAVQAGAGFATNAQGWPLIIEVK